MSVRQERLERVPELVSTSGADFVVRALADHVELALEGLVVGAVRAALDEHLAHERLGRLGRVADRRIVHRHIAPSDHLLSLLARDLFKNLRALRAFGRVGRDVDHAHSVPAGFGKLDFLRGTDLLQERVRYLHQDARAVAGVHFAAARAAMIEVHQDRERLLHDLVGFFPLHVDDETHAARVMLELRIVKALLWR